MKKGVAVLLCIALIFCYSSAIAAATDNRDISYETSLASGLRELGLFMGVSATDFDLSRAPTRTEAIVMLIRLLGKEDEVRTGSWTHPFNDVDGWADGYIGYAYENRLTRGISSTEFGRGDATASMYITFVLRALGYSDENNADFSWDNPFELARHIGILPASVSLSPFWRADVVTVSYFALAAERKNTSQILASYLIINNVFSELVVI